MLEQPSLLITDDDHDFRETLREVFEPQGFRTLLASDGVEALSILDQNPVHVMLLDMHMPRMTGLETVRQMKNRQSKNCQPVVPWILLSAGLDEVVRAEAKQAQAFSVLSKPISHREVTRIVCQAMQRVYGWQQR